MIDRATDASGTTFPREFISYGNHSRDYQIRRFDGPSDTSLISGRAVVDAYYDVSRVRCQTYLTEFRDLQDHIKRFRGKHDAPFSRSELIDMFAGLDLNGDDAILFQARGLVHFHAIVRLDGAEDRATAPGVAVSSEELCAAIRKAAGRAQLQGDGGGGDGETVDMRFGEQLHTRVLTGAEETQELSPGQVAAYVAKYSCKASHEQITSRDTDPDRLIADEHGRLVYLGQARRDGGILARLDGHAAEALKRDTFRDVWVLPLHDRTDPQTVAVIEGRIADDLALRGRLKAGRRDRVWPSATRWTELVASTHAATRAASAAD